MMPTYQCLWLNDEQRLFQGPNHPGQKHQEEPIVLVNTGRLTCRLRLISCWRRNAFSATSSDLFLARSASDPNNSEVVDGF